MSEIEKPTYPKFNPQLHLITDSYYSSSDTESNPSDLDSSPEHSNFSFDINKLNLFSKECTSYLEPVSHNCFPVFSPSCIKIIQWELNNYLIKKDECYCLKQFQKNNISFLNFESPSMKNCKKRLPFLYDAFTSSNTIELLSNKIGFPIEIVPDYEIAHFAKKLDSENKKIVDKMDLGASSKIIIRNKSVAYPYICLIKINQDDIYEKLPTGYAFFLKGRLIENLAGKIIFKKNSPNEMVLCPSYVPKQIKYYEDFKQKQISSSVMNAQNSKRKIRNRRGIFKTNDKSVDYKKDIQSIKKYKTWLNKYYQKAEE